MSTEDNISNSFKEVYETYKYLVFDTARTYCNDDYQIMEDVVQLVFVDCYLEEIYMKDAKYIVTWLKRVARNKAVSLWRKRKHEIAVAQIYPDDAATEYKSLDEEHIANEEKLGREELSERILEGLYEKNIKWYDGIIAKYYFDESDEEIAEKMGMSINSFRCMMSRARAWIKKYYQV